LVSDIYNNGASVLAWSDGRQDAGGIYAQNIQADGSFGGVVPVELISFTALLNGNSIKLKWQTVTETNNSGFEIQKANDEDWESIGFVPGYGTTTERHHYSFIDDNVSTGIYNYRLKQIDFDGSLSYSKTVEVEITSPWEYQLYQNYPNPFNPSTKISWQLPVSGNVTLKIFNAIGEEIKTLVDEEFLEAGSHSSLFIVNSLLPSGVYFYQLKAVDLSTGSGQSFVEVKKMVLLR
jgi:hypothetical protein